ncbi:MAG: 4-hydroxy-tetrahydrodipicolinate synthase [Pseudomonadota bacterium]|nr:4-hydroxy-tetrahydrodipicolinate synthase [Pseudomonadota bacterium]
MIAGSLVALVTPMDTDGDVVWEELEALVDWHVEEGTDGIVAVGTTGESATLGFDEHVEVIRRTVDFARGRIPVIGGTGANNTREAVELTARAKAVGVESCLLVVPYYNKPTQEGLYQHFRTVAEAVAIPQLLYNVPGRTITDLLPETVARLAEVDGIIGIKEATGQLERYHEIRQRCGEDFVVYSGDDATAIDLILNGAQGTVSVTANVAPRVVAESCRHARAGDMEQARRLDSGIAHLHTDLFMESSPIPVKWALHEMGRISPGIRLPLTPLSPALRPKLQDSLRKAGVL